MAPQNSKICGDNMLPRALWRSRPGFPRETAKRQSSAVSTNIRGDMPDARLPQEGRITPRQRSDDETNSGNWSSARLQRSVIPGGAWRIDEADCDSPSEGSSSRHISPSPCTLKGTVLYCYVFGNSFISYFLVYNYRAKISAVVFCCAKYWARRFISAEKHVKHKLL